MESIWLPLVILFFAFVVVIELFLFAYRTLSLKSLKKAKSRLRRVSYAKIDDEYEISNRAVLSEIGAFNSFLKKISFSNALHNLVVMAKAPYPVSVYILLSLILAGAGYGAVFIFLKTFLFAALIGAAGFLLPWGYLSAKKRIRMKKFERQLPEALDLVARSLRAGVSFSGALQHITENFDDPLGTEFAEALYQINYGYSVEDALKNMTKRVECKDLQFFVISVVLQGETGGNLAEISESISRVIRERFKFRDKVQALTAEGKLTAVILGSLPFFIIAALFFLNPGYLTPLYTETTGKLISLLAILFMGFGVFVITRIIDIDV